MAYVDQLECYEQSNEVSSKFLSVEVSVVQVYRVTDTYGALRKQQIAKEEEPEQAPLDIKRGESVYVIVNGPMILTREEGWKEVKLGRIFKESDCMEQKLDAYPCLKYRLIFISDGAVWIKNWTEDAYHRPLKYWIGFTLWSTWENLGKNILVKVNKKRAR